VLFYRNRGLGDQLIASCLPRFFTDVLGAKCFQLADPVHEPLWLGNPYIQGAPTAVPIGIDSLVRARRPFYDYAFFLESVSEWDSEPEQENVYDRLFALVGFRNVPDRFKIPYFPFTQVDRDVYQNWITGPNNIDLSRGYIFYQLRATNRGRTIPLETQSLLLTELDKLGLPILCVDDMPPEQPVREMIGSFKNAHDFSRRIDNIRFFGILIANATLVVAPDSLAIHFAAASQTPCLSVWGPFDPQSRIKYYPRQIALSHPEQCPNAFCYNYQPNLPAHLCPEGEKQKDCACYRGVTTQEISDALAKLLHQSATMTLAAR
jgi:ADP-heptose:LPS heptosyltransferase